MSRRTIDLSCGSIEVEDTGGTGPVVVLLHGLLMDGTLWDDVVADLRHGHRCVVPTLPLGAHAVPVSAGADLSLPAVAESVLELLHRLELEDVTVIGNDTGGVLVQLIAAGEAPRIGRIGLVSCDAFDNFPPPMAKPVLLAGRLPAPLFGAFMQPMRLKAMRRLPFAFGLLTRRGDATTKRWMASLLRDAGVRRDAVRVLRAYVREPDLLLKAAERLPGWRRPAMIAWAREDRVMPPEHAERLADLLPDARVVMTKDSRTLIPLDQPAWLAAQLRAFVADTTHAVAR